MKIRKRTHKLKQNIIFKKLIEESSSQQRIQENNSKALRLTLKLNHFITPLILPKCSLRNKSLTLMIQRLNNNAA